MSAARGRSCARRAAAAERPASRGRGLLRVELDDELLQHRRGDLASLGLAQHLRRQRVVVRLQPRRHLTGQLRCLADRLRGTAGGLDGDHVAIAERIARNVDAAAVDRPMAVPDELARLAARRGEAEAHEHVVEAALEHAQQVLAGDPGLTAGLLIVRAELALEHAVVAARLLLLAELDAVLALSLTPAAVVSGRVRATLDAALVGQAALALEEELLALPPALLALRAGVSCHAESSLDAPPLARPAPVVGLRGHVTNRRHLEAGGLKRADRGLAAGAGTLHEDLDLLQAVLDALASGRVGGHLRGERSRLARALEAGAAGGLPRDHVPLAVGQRDDRVVEARLDVSLTEGNVLLRLAAAAWPCGTVLCHYFVTFFLPATCMRFGPLRVRPLVLVRWPLTGRPRRWRRPRYEPISMRRLTFWERSRRRSPSTVRSVSIASRSLMTSSSVRSRT